MPLISTNIYTTPTRSADTFPGITKPTPFLQPPGFDFTSPLALDKRQFEFSIGIGPGFPTGSPTDWSQRPGQSSSEHSSTSNQNSTSPPSTSQIPVSFTSTVVDGGSTHSSPTTAEPASSAQPMIVATQSTNGHTTAIIAGSAVAGSVIALVAIGFCIFFIMRRRFRKHLQDTEERMSTPLSLPGGVINSPIAVPVVITEKGTLFLNGKQENTVLAETAPGEAPREGIPPPRKARARMNQVRGHSPTLNHAVTAGMSTVLNPHGRRHSTGADAVHTSNTDVRSQVAFLQEEMRVNMDRVMQSVQRLEAHIEPTNPGVILDARDTVHVERGTLVENSIPDVPPPTYTSLSL
ncbi:hypothetical protein F5880DRAFT_1311203 [Lentinula raphanica]|nr:hypothetical protein F5880DRAFT_1311203 [Lentinula raphanica]